MATMVPISDPTFHTNVSDLYGDRDGVPLATDRHLYRETVASVASRAKAAMEPRLHSRIDAAQRLLLAGDVALRADGTATVASQSHGAVQHLVVSGTCPCRGFATAPQGWCAHRLAVAIATRTHQALAIADAQLAADGVPQEDAQPQEGATMPAPLEPPTPELTPDMHLLAPYIVTIHGQVFVKYAGLLALARTRGLVSLKASFISVTETLALAAAEATFADGQTYSECADSTPQNVGLTVKTHFPRIALTRAKGRALRDALGVNMTALEELGE